MAGVLCKLAAVSAAALTVSFAAKLGAFRADTNSGEGVNRI